MGEATPTLRRTSGQRAHEVDVVWFFGEQRWVDRLGKTATLTEVEADGGSSGGSGDIEGSRSGLSREVGRCAPQHPRRTVSSMRSAHVEESEPAAPRFKRWVDDRQPHQRVTVERAEKDPTIGQELSAVRDLGGEAVLAESFPIP